MKKKKVIVNASNIASGGSIGVAVSTARHFLKNGNFHFIILASPAVRACLDSCDRSENIIEIDAIGLKGLLNWRRFRSIEKEVEPDAVFTIFGPTHWQPRVPHLVGFAWPHLVFQESPYFAKLNAVEHFVIRTKIEIKKYQFKKTATSFVTESQEVSRRLSHVLDLPEGSVATVSNCLPASFHLYSGDQRADRNVRERTKVLMVSAYYPHKNFEFIPRLIAALASKKEEGIDIVTTLPSTAYRDLNIEKSSRWLNIGPVELSALPSIYEDADCVLHTSLLECFSVSYLEAMFMYKPIVVPDLPFARDVCEEVGFFYDPDDPHDAADAILNCLASVDRDRLERGRRRAQNFGTGEDRANKYLEIIDRLSCYPEGH